jgi:hypothetical protein
MYTSLKANIVIHALNSLRRAQNIGTSHFHVTCYRIMQCFGILHQFVLLSQFIGITVLNGSSTTYHKTLCPQWDVGKECNRKESISATEILYCHYLTRN